VITSSALVDSSFFFAACGDCDVVRRGGDGGGDDDDDDDDDDDEDTVERNRPLRRINPRIPPFIQLTKSNNTRRNRMAPRSCFVLPTILGASIARFDLWVYVCCCSRWPLLQSITFVRIA